MSISYLFKMDKFNLKMAEVSKVPEKSGVYRIHSSLEFPRLNNKTAYIDKLDGRILQTKYDEFTVLWRNEQAENRQKKEQHEKTNINYFELGSKLLEVSKNAKNIYKRRSDDEKRQLMALIFSNLTLKNKILSKTYSKPFAIVAERVKSNNMSAV